MKIGIYLPDVKPEAGGASSLLKTIRFEIENLNETNNEYIFIYKGDNRKVEVSEFQGFEYLNITYYKPRTSLLKSIKNKIKKIIGMSILPSEFDLAAKKNAIDLFWFPYPACVDLSYPYIYTIWDLGHRRAPYFPEVSRSGQDWNSREYCYQHMVYKASYIITGNEEGKKEILENYPVPPSKIRISPFPVASFCRGNEKKPSFDMPEQFFFYPAQFWPHKNHICILESLIILREKYGLKPSVFLTGSDKGNKKYIESKIIDFGLEKQVYFTGFLKDEELKWMYTHATAMIFASLMGPNNMPPVEATYLNCPVIITDLDGHKEQLKDAALYFNGYKPEELAEHIKTLLLDAKKRKSFVSKQKKLAPEFDKINYFSCIKQIIDEFSSVRKTWGEDFVHL